MSEEYLSYLREMANAATGDALLAKLAKEAAAWALAEIERLRPLAELGELVESLGKYPLWNVSLTSWKGYFTCRVHDGVQTLAVGVGDTAEAIRKALEQAEGETL